MSTNYSHKKGKGVPNQSHKNSCEVSINPALKTYKDTITNYTPISLMNVDVKVSTKSLQNLSPEPSMLQYQTTRKNFPNGMTMVGILWGVTK